MQKTQQQWVAEQLKKHGKITRNQCLRRYISRLGAIIFDLKADGWNIIGRHKKTENGRDYEYVLVK